MWGAAFLQGLFSSSCVCWLNYGTVNELLGWLSFFWSNHTYCSSLLPPCKIWVLVATHLRIGRCFLGDDYMMLTNTFLWPLLLPCWFYTRQGLMYLLISKGMNSSHATISSYYVLTQETSQINFLSVLSVALYKDLPNFLSKWAHMWCGNWVWCLWLVATFFFLLAKTWTNWKGRLNFRMKLNSSKCNRSDSEPCNYLAFCSIK